MESLSEVLNRLRKRGFEKDFCRSSDMPDVLSSEDFKIEEICRIDVQSDPGDQAIVYAISSRDGLKKGVVINGFGLYSDSTCNLLIDDLEASIKQKAS